MKVNLSEQSKRAEITFEVERDAQNGELTAIGRPIMTTFEVSALAHA